MMSHIVSYKGIKRAADQEFNSMILTIQFACLTYLDKTVPELATVTCEETRSGSWYEDIKI